jgi:hypothetical protein
VRHRVTIARVSATSPAKQVRSADSLARDVGRSWFSMVESMRKPFFVVSLIAIFLAVLVELGSIAMLGQPAKGLDITVNGKAIPAMALLDGLVCYATLIIGIALLIPERVQSKVQGIVTLIFSVLLLLACIGIIMADITLLILMVTLLMSPIFGTIAYFAVWATFVTSGPRIALSLLMTLKIVFAVCLVLAHQRFLQNKGLVLIIVTSFLANLIIAFLYGLVPGFLVSIADVIAAIIICILAIIWAVIYLIGGVVSVIKVVL